ncbi:MAG: cell division protein ZipA C-terminal FtsZ-binding domain-containing protein [Sterolibacterium sp.]
MFNELQWTLIGAGMAAVAGVWGYNTWQAYRQRKLAQQIFRSDQADALLPQEEGAPCARQDEPVGETQRIEPTFVEDGAVEEPEAVEAAEGFVDTSDTPPNEPPLELADKLTDCIVLIEAAEMVAAPLLWAAQRKLLGKLEGRLRWSGWDENNGQWKLLHAHDATSYRRLCAALQIVDRNGPISETDLAGFFGGVRELAENFQIKAELPAVAEVLARAHALDEFCASVDWRIGINVVTRDGNSIPAAHLIDFATETDLWLKNDGFFHAEDASGQTLFTLSQLGGATFSDRGLSALSLPGVTLSIDVPRVADGRQAFDLLLEVAGKLVTVFAGMLVDDQRAPLSDEILATIRSKIGEFQQKMSAHDIPAGGQRAMRLYS